MTSLLRLVRTLGAAGAAANARRACEERELIEARLVARLDAVAGATPRAERRHLAASA